MFVNAIRFRTKFEDQFQLWKFQHGTGNKQNIVCFQSDSERLNDFQDALKYAVSGQAVGTIEEVALQLTDDSGDIWILERSFSKMRMLRNGKALSDLSIANTLLASLFDLDESSADGEVFDYNAICQTFEVSADSTSLMARKKIPNDRSKKRTFQLVNNSQSSLFISLSKLFDQPLFLDKEKTLSLSRRVKPLFYANREVLRQKRSLLASVKSLDDLDVGLLNQLEQETKLLDEIYETAAPLLEPAYSPKVVKEKLSKIEIELKKELQACHVSSLPVSFEPIPWHKLAKCLCSLEAQRKLIEVSEQAQNLSQERLEPIHEEYLKTVENLISSDSQIISELESCLSTLSLHTEDCQKSPRRSVFDLIGKFVRPSADVTTQESEETKRARLDNSRMAVDFALARLGELHSNVDDLKLDFEKLQHELRDHHEELVSSYGRLKDHWLRLSKEHRIPENIELPDLMRLIYRYAHLNELYNKQLSYKEFLEQRKSSLIRLEEQILEWRRVSNSQKDEMLNTSTILLAEARGILRYKDKKKAQLERLRTLQDHLRAHAALKSTIEARQSQILTGWKESFHEVEIPLIAIERSEWPEFFSLSDQLAAWESLRQKDDEPLVDKEIFADGASNTPISVFIWDKSYAQSKSGTLLLEQAISTRSSTDLQFVLVTDSMISELLKSNGCGFSKALTSKKKSGVQQPTKASIVDEKSKDVLSVFNRPTNRLTTP